MTGGVSLRPFSTCHCQPFFTCHCEPFASCHSDPEPFAFSHSERSEESGATQGKLRKGEESQDAQDRLRVAIPGKVKTQKSKCKMTEQK